MAGEFARAAQGRDACLADRVDIDAGLNDGKERAGGAQIRVGRVQRGRQIDNAFGYDGTDVRAAVVAKRKKLHGGFLVVLSSGIRRALYLIDGASCLDLMVKPADMENSANIMRVALILSILGHVLFVTFSARELRPTAHGDAMTLELIPANEAPAGPDLGAQASAEQAKKARAEPTAEKPSAAWAPTIKTESGPSETKAPDPKPPETKVAQSKPTSAPAATKPIEQKPQQPQPQ